MKLKLIIRRLLQKKGIVSINLFGLAVALCTTIFLVFYIVQEQSYDKHIPNHERMYRLLSLWQEGSKTEKLPINLSENLLQLKENIPEVEEVVQIYRGGDSYFKVKDHVIADNPTFQVDQNFFNVFNFKPVYGTLTGALNSPDKIVVSQKTSRKVFGERNPVGESVILDGKPFTVTAVIENIPDNTHFYFDVLKPIPPDIKKYESLEFFTYILFKENANRDIAITKCEQRVIETLTKRFRDFDFVAGAKLEPIADIHLKTIADFDFKENGNITLIVFLFILSAIILIIALTNYINLFLAQKEGFVKHVSIQKIFGSTSRQNIALLFGESSAVIVFSFIFAFLLFSGVKSWVANYIGIDFIRNLWQSPQVFLMLGLLLIISMLAAALYPAVYINRAIKTGNRHVSSKSFKKVGKKQLLVFQFSLVSFLIIGILTIHTQIKYIDNKPKGFSSENVINYKRITNKLVDKWILVSDELKAIPHVVEVTGSHSYPGSGGSGQGISYNDSPVFSIDEARVQHGYLDVFGIELAEGRFFNKPGLEKDAVILNRTAVKELGIENPVGKYIHFDNGYTNDGKVQIIGVVNDYNYESLKQKIAPLMLTNYRNDIYTISIKTDGSDNKKVISEANAVFNQIDPGYRIVFNYFDAELARMYAPEHALRRIFYLGTFLGILVALMGLMAFAALSIELRTKEIGIRKVNGAKVSEILTMLNKDFVKWVVIAFVFATPVAYYAMNKWLENFAYKTNLSWWIFALAGMLALGIALLTVSWQSWKAATRNPVEALRYE